MLDPKFAVSTLEEKDNYYKLSIEPLKQGYGHTLGNSLRRVLLSSLKGAAVTSVKIKGVNHQFTTLEGMKEDIVQFILNIKKIHIDTDGKDEKVQLKLEAKGPGEIKAGDIKCPVGTSITNPELVLCDLADKKNTLSVTFTVETGWGYSVAEDRKSTAVGVIPVDALFSPIKRVTPTVQSTRVGRRTDFDKLILEIWTDGTITGNQALDEAAKILVEHFQQIYNPSESPVSKQEEESPYPHEIISLTVEELELPTRIANALRKGGYKTVSDLISASREDISKVKNLGERSVEIVSDALKQKDVNLQE